MTAVVDANVAIKWFVQQQGSDDARRVLEDAVVRNQALLSGGTFARVRGLLADDLAEAEDLATRGPMPLYLADIHLYRGRLFKDREALAESRRLIEKHGYLRRLGELEDAERSLST